MNKRLRHVSDKQTIVDCRRLASYLGSAAMAVVNKRDDYWSARAGWMFGAIPCGHESFGDTEQEAVDLLANDLINMVSSRELMDILCRRLADAVISAGTRGEILSPGETYEYRNPVGTAEDTIRVLDCATSRPMNGTL